MSQEKNEKIIAANERPADDQAVSGNDAEEETWEAFMLELQATLENELCH